VGERARGRGDVTCVPFREGGCGGGLARTDFHDARIDWGVPMMRYWPY